MAAASSRCGDACAGDARRIPAPPRPPASCAWCCSAPAASFVLPISIAAKRSTRPECRSIGSDFAGLFSTSAIRVSSRSASAAGLSVRMRAMRGNRSATPDLCRVDSCAASNATSSTSAFSTSRTGPNRADGVVADPAVEERQLLVGEAEIGLADRHQLVVRATRRTCSRNRSCCACRGRAARTSAPRRWSADRASISTTGPSPGPAHRRCRRASASAPRSRRRARRRAAPSVHRASANRISSDRSMRAGRVRAYHASSRARRASNGSGRTSSAPSNSMSYSRMPTGILAPSSAR